MSSSNNRFGRRTGRQSDEPRFEPVLSFNPKRPAARAAQSGPAPTPERKPQTGLRVEREDAREFGISFGEDDGNERQDDFDPRTRREKALEQRVPEAERPLYHHLFDEQENRRRGVGWVAALGSVVVVAAGVVYAWHNFMERPAPANLFEPRGIATRGNSGYTTPQQPANGGDSGTAVGSTPAPLAATQPAAVPPAATPSAPSDQPPAKDVAAVPEPKSVPAEAPPPPRKTISEAAANPGNLGPAVPVPPPAPPTAREQPAAAPPPQAAPPPKRAAANSDAPKREAPRRETAITPPKPMPPETPRKEASIAPPRQGFAPAPRNVAPEDIAPPLVSEPAAAPAVTAPRRNRPQANGQPQSLTRNAPADYAPPPQDQAPRQYLQPNNAGPPTGASDLVTVDGVNYVNGQEPRALGTLGGSPQAAGNDGGVPAYAAPPPQAAPPAYRARPYTPTDHDGGAPLPNDVIILPSGQMAVPSGGP